jgi:hypothetical protein
MSARYGVLMVMAASGSIVAAGKRRSFFCHPRGKARLEVQAKMVERLLGFERTARWRKQKFEKAPAAFAVANGVAKATKVMLQ